MGLANTGRSLPHTDDWNKKIGLAQKADKNHAWKADRVGYKGLHDWINKNLGKPKTCEHCKKTNMTGRQIDWANKTGKYLRDSDDWLRLCKSCHRIYDLKNKEK